MRKINTNFEKYVFGKVRNIQYRKYLIKKIIEVVISHPSYDKYADKFNKVNWNEYETVSVAFQNLLTVLNKEDK